MIAFVCAMVLATQVSRLTPLAFSKLKISRGFESWLGHVPIAILAALITPEFFHRHDAAAALQVNWLFVSVAGLCMLIGYVSKNLLFTTFAGMVAVALYRILVV